jgi:hypothetical protein
MLQAAGDQDPALAERLRRVMGETSGRSIERRVFVGGMPFSYEVHALLSPMPATCAGCQPMPAACMRL